MVKTIKIAWLQTANRIIRNSLNEKKRQKKCSPPDQHDPFSQNVDNWWTPAKIVIPAI